ncbi:molybdenum cofactor guanylyltransferase MobA [Agrobacterium sp. ES01]|uniref:molybdenum cofactor guanylyltransferase MobA n=1 Tax=Agrobacterium sp. ES01 TaxID=3420714 RepID=UPI003D147B45
MRGRPAGLILAGGLSRRMGENKALAVLAGQPMIAHVADRLAPQVKTLAINAPAEPPLPLGLPVIQDTIKGYAGPLAGILAGLRHFAHTAPETAYMLSVAVDTPFLPADLAKRLLDATSTADEIVIARSNDRLHPVIALWPLNLADELEAWLVDPQHRKLQDFIARHTFTVVDFSSDGTTTGAIDPFFNVNSPDDLLRAQTMLDTSTP